LEVRKSATSNYAVTVAPGVAIDNRGREIILLEPREVVVIGAPAPLEGVAFGNFVAIEYGEELTSPVPLSACTPKGAMAGRDAPSRIALDPRIVFLDRWPSADSGRIVLAQIELRQNCVVDRINTSVRRYVAAAKPPRTRTITLEGEKDIDPTNPKVLCFHVEGDSPSTALLYLYGGEFSSFYYSELGGHTRTVALTTHDETLMLRHTHTATGGTTNEEPDHTHNYLVDGGERRGGIDVNDDQVVGRINTDTSAILPAGHHTHTVSGMTLDPALQDGPHHHDVSGATASAGAGDGAARAGNRLRYLDDLQVVYDGRPITPQILSQLKAKPGQAALWDKLGDRTQAHALNTPTGTGAIDLIALGVVDLSPGQRHELHFIVASGGGQIGYNLYIA
jgi:hypothetical protein